MSRKRPAHGVGADAGRQVDAIFAGRSLSFGDELSRNLSSSPLS
jgi:hypothetical protein